MCSDKPDPVDLLRQITETVTAERTGVSEALLQAIVTSMPAVLAVIDPQGMVLWPNRTAAGPSVRDVVGRSMFDLMPTADQANARAAFERVVSTNRPDRYIGFGPGSRGPRSRYDTWLGPITRDKQVIAIALITRDVSEEWELYETLRDREQRLSVVLRAAGMGTWRFDAHALTIELDENARGIYGLTSGRLSSRVFTTSHIHPDDRDAVDQQALAAVAELRPYVSRNRIIRADGKVRWVEITGSPIVDERRQLAGLMGTVTDITERRDLEERMFQAQRLDAVGQLTAGIAHNFNNLLAAIMPTLSIIEKEVRPDSVSLVRGASQATERAASLIRQLMTFSGRNPKQERRVEVTGALVERTFQLCRSTFDRGISLQLEIQPDLPAVRVDAGQIDQALLNLLLNARDAVREANPADPEIRVRVSCEPGTVVAEQQRVLIVVADNGPGIPVSLREKIFDPFFTTKSVGSGTGLGLSTAYAIARDHGGDLRYEDETGRGARFTLSLPAVDATPAITVESPRSSTRMQGTVLVVDDEALVRETVARVLDDEGFTVFTAGSVEQALVVVAARAEVEVVLLDLNMPGTPWRTLVANIRRDHPTVRIVAFSGGTTLHDLVLDGWLAKPASPEEIIEAIIKATARRVAT